MKARRLILAATAWLCFGHGLPAVRAQEANEGTLRVCLNRSLPPYSVRHGDTGSGFDLLISEALAKRLGRRLAVQWFESKLDEASNSTVEADALLSDGRCELVAGYPLVKDALGKPDAESARLPDFAGSRPGDRRRRVALGTLIATTPYHFAPLTVVLGGKAAPKRIGSLADLDDVSLGIESGTLGDGILMTFDHGRLIPNITHMIPERGELLPRLENGEYDATIMPLHHFDAYRIDHPNTKLTASGYYLKIGFNMGFVGLAEKAVLIEQANPAIENMLKDGEASSLARLAHMTYVPPRRPYILEHLSLGDLAKEQ